MIEQQKFITCPKCQKRLQVNNAKMVTEKVIACPNCQTKLLVKFEKKDMPLQPIYDATPQQAYNPYQRQPQVEKETQYPGMPQQGAYGMAQPVMQPVAQPVAQPATPQAPPRRSDETLIGTANTGSQNPQTPKYRNPRLECMGRTYPLRPGRSTLGRACTTHDASLEIYTGTDNTMSRIHATINVIENDGSFETTIKHYEGATNKTYVGGKELSPYDEPFLHPGQSIRMGLIEMRYMADPVGGFQTAPQPSLHPQQPPQYQAPPLYQQQPQHQAPPQYQQPTYQPPRQPQYQQPQQPQAPQYQRPPMPPRPPQWGGAPRQNNGGDETVY